MCIQALGHVSAVDRLLSLNVKIASKMLLVVIVLKNNFFVKNVSRG